MSTIDAGAGMTCREAARRVGVHHNTIYAWIQKGDLTVSRYGPSGRIVKIAEGDLARAAAVYGKAVQPTGEGR